LEINDRPFDELTPRQLHDILQLRSAVFVVEQDCVFLEPDGLDPECRLLWVEDDEGRVVATARVHAEGGGTHIGRIVTASTARRHGLAGRLLDHALGTTAGPWFLKAQAHLAPYYERFGFEVDGPAFDEDGIAHVPMRRRA
jgi:ElaA protein